MVRVTPLVSIDLGDGGPSVALKLENLQTTGSFKLRGAVRAVASMGETDRRRGAVAASAGNFGAGMALACRAARVPITVVVSSATPEVKRQNIASLGANLIVTGADYDAAEAAARELARDRGARFVSPFDDDDVIEGNGGDLARELLAQAPDLACVLAPVGGGGLVGGLGRALEPRGVRVIGVQPAANCAMRDSLAVGRALVQYQGGATLADALAGGVGERAYELVARHVESVVVVDEADIRRAMKWLYLRAGVVAEPSGAVTTAALLAGVVVPAERGLTVAVVSGGNVDAQLLDEVLAG